MHKLIVSDDQSLEFYDYTSDLQELHNLYDPDSPIVRQLEPALRRVMAGGVHQSGKPIQVEFAHELREELDALGYVR